MTSKSLNAGAATFTPGGSNKDAAAATTSIGAAATSSSPSEASYNHDSFLEYAEMVETIEDIMDEESEHSPTVTLAPPSIETGLPPHLVNHAAEFWFPDSRDCTCCKGFKFGCKCVTVDGGGVCKYCGSGASSVATAPAPAPLSSPPSSSMQQATDAPRAAVAAIGGSSTGFQSNQYGADHSNRPSYTTTTTTTNSIPTHSGGRGYNPDTGGGGKRKVVCKFFLSPSGCRNGGSCTFEHVSQT
jgi:hypothetical protein